jgi:hypothetical protein
LTDDFLENEAGRILQREEEKRKQRRVLVGEVWRVELVPGNGTGKILQSVFRRKKR